MDRIGKIAEPSKGKNRFLKFLGYRLFGFFELDVAPELLIIFLQFHTIRSVALTFHCPIDFRALCTLELDLLSAPFLCHE